MLFSATMVKDYDKYLSKDLIWGEELKESDLVVCGNQSNAD